MRTRNKEVKKSSFHMNACKSVIGEVPDRLSPALSDRESVQLNTVADEHRSIVTQHIVSTHENLHPEEKSARE